MRMLRCFAIAASVSTLLMLGCKPEPIENPYAPAEGDIEGSQVNGDLALPASEPGSFGWIHEQVFLPTCANAGCHDGTFEPDFRTIGSSYNTLVMHPVISNDAAGSFAHRVVPGDPPGSLLLKRLLTSIPNTSGQMPLQVDEGSDWPTEGENHIAAITDWIAEGAPNAAGDMPMAAGDVNLPPVVAGFGGFAAGTFSEPFPRDPDAGYALVVSPGLVDLWFAFEDATTPTDALQATLRVAGSPSGFTGATPTPISPAATSFEAPAFFGNTSTYAHKVTLDLGEWADTETDTVLYLQVALTDGEANIVAPGPASPTYMSTLFSLIFP